MYVSLPIGQLSFEDFHLPFSGKLSSQNRWVKLANLIPWQDLEVEYASQFDARLGAPAKPFRMALGALIIQERLGLTDRETIDQITENPYLQYFLGLSEYQLQAPFDASMMVHFRKRLSRESITRINDMIVSRAMAEEAKKEVSESESSSAADKRDDSSNGDDDDNSGNSPSDNNQDSSPPHQGKLILDATCAPADIHYPVDLNLLNEAREHSERILDKLYPQVKDAFSEKPRTYRQQARKAFLSVAKQRKPKRKKIRRAIRKQLGYLRRNLAHIDKLLATGASLTVLNRQQYRTLLVISEVFQQQHEMYQRKTHRVDHRIVSISQPHIRPIIRGKAGTPVEFGAKLSVSCHAGYVFLDELSWENFNEVTHLQGQVERFRERFGHYPESVHADRIYRSRDNLEWCKERGIRLCGPPLGRPPSDPRLHAQQKKQARQDELIRIEIEGKFGQAKRRFGLNRVMAKLAETAESRIAITFLVMNLERWLRRQLFLWLWPICLGRKGDLEKALKAIAAQLVTKVSAWLLKVFSQSPPLDPVSQLSLGSHFLFSANPK